MKKNTNPATSGDLKNVENNNSRQQKVREGQPDSSILADKHPIRPVKTTQEKPYEQQDEFIDHNNNSKQQD